MNAPLLLAIAVAVSLSARPLVAQNEPGHVQHELLITQGLGGFAGGLATADIFGSGVADLGDVDGDGVSDYAVGAMGAITSGPDAQEGRVWVLFMNPDGSVNSSIPIDKDSLALAGLLDVGDRFGCAVEPAGDLDGDGVPDIWIGARGDDDGASPSSTTGPGAVYGVTLFTSGKVKGVQKISGLTPGLDLDPEGAFGESIARVGDIYGDGTEDLLVGAAEDDTFGPGRGAAFLFDLTAGGAIQGVQRLGPGGSVFNPYVTEGASFGSSVEGLGDVDGNGTPDFAIGAYGDGTASAYSGSIFIYFNDSAGPIALRKINASTPGFSGDAPQSNDFFGVSLAALGDIDGDGLGDLAVGARFGGPSSSGAIWMLRLRDDPDNLLKGATLVDGDHGFLDMSLDIGHHFGMSLAAVGDRDGNGVLDLLAGVGGYDGAADNQGAVVLLSLRGATVRDLGHGLAGDYAPRLEATGQLLAGTQFSVLLSEAQPLKSPFLVLGVSPLYAPFRGGTMVPEVDLLTGALTADAAGKLTLSATWPAGVPEGFTTYLQYWAPDSGAPVGLNASNAVGLVAAE